MSTHADPEHVDAASELLAKTTGWARRQVAEFVETLTDSELENLSVIAGQEYSGTDVQQALNAIADRQRAGNEP